GVSRAASSSPQTCEAHVAALQSFEGVGQSLAAWQPPVPPPPAVAPPPPALAPPPPALIAPPPLGPLLARLEFVAVPPPPDSPTGRSKFAPTRLAQPATTAAITGTTRRRAGP